MQAEANHGAECPVVGKHDVRVKPVEQATQAERHRPHVHTNKLGQTNFAKSASTV